MAGRLVDDVEDHPERLRAGAELGRGLWANENPQSSYDEVRVWKIALTKEQVEECIRLGPDTLPEFAYPPARGFMIFVE